MRRYPDWEKRLLPVITAAQQSPFVWGRQDCALFACDSILAMTGIDLAAPLRGTYDSAATAQQAICSFVGKDDATVEDVAIKVTALNAMEAINPLSAGRGDVCSVDSETGPALGIVALEGFTVLVVNRQGLSRVPLSRARRAWRVG